MAEVREPVSPCTGAATRKYQPATRGHVVHREPGPHIRRWYHVRLPLAAVMPLVERLVADGFLFGDPAGSYNSPAEATYTATTPRPSRYVFQETFPDG